MNSLLATWWRGLKIVIPEILASLLEAVKSTSEFVAFVGLLCWPLIAVAVLTLLLEWGDPTSSGTMLVGFVLTVIWIFFVLVPLKEGRESGNGR